MKNLSGIFLHPLITIRRTAKEEPFSSLILLFAISIVAARYRYLLQASAYAGSAVNWIAATIFLWGGLIVAGDFLIYAMMNILLPFSSRVLNRERFRKLVAVSLNISLLLLLKPLIAVIAGDTVSVLIIGLYGLYLISYATAHIWNENTYKPVIAVIASLLLSGSLYYAAQYKNYAYPRELMALADAVGVYPETAENSLFFETGSVIKDTETAIGKINGFLAADPYSKAAGYPLIAKAAVLAREGNTEAAEAVLQDILTIKNIKGHVRLNARYLMYNISPDSRNIFFVGSPGKNPVKAAGPVYVKQCDSFSEPAVYMAFNIMRAIAAAENEDLNKIAALISKDRYLGGFKDDILFSIALRYEKNGMADAAEKIYLGIVSSAGKTDRNRLLTETAVSVLERSTGVTLLYDKCRAPYALQRLAGIYDENGDAEKASMIGSRIISGYACHEVFCWAILRTAGRELENGNFKAAISLYDKLSASCLPVIYKDTASAKKMFIERNISRKDILVLYAAAHKEWAKGDSDKAVRILKKIVDTFPDAPESGNMLMGIAKYYAGSGHYSEAIKELRNGYNRYKNIPIGFELGMEMGFLLTDELGYHGEAVAWFEKMIKDFSYAYISRMSGTAVSDILFKIADIAQNKEKDYHKAVQVNMRIAGNYADHKIAARALYNSAYISETRLNDLYTAVSHYKKVIAKYTDTEYAVKAKNRMGLIKGQVPGSPKDKK